MVRFVDLFCGGGGSSCGARNAGWECVGGVDCNRQALDTYAINFKGARVLECNMGHAEDQNAVVDAFSGVDAVIGGPPCQGFSKRNMNKGAKHEQMNKLPFAFADAAVRMNPGIVIMEEVVGAAAVVGMVAERLTDAGYCVQWQKYVASDHGVPQNRRRLILVACKPPYSFSVPERRQPVSIAEALSRPPVPARGKVVSDATRSRIIEVERSGERLIGGNYALMDTSKPAPTIHTQTHSCTGPYTIRRGDDYCTLSVEEAARLQSFPPDYVFSGSDAARRKVIGNAVPPALLEAVARSIRITDEA